MLAKPKKASSLAFVFLDLYKKNKPNIIPKITTPEAVIPSIQPLTSKGKFKFHLILLSNTLEKEIFIRLLYYLSV